MSAWASVRQVWDLLNAVRARLQLPSPNHDEFELMWLRAQWQELDWKAVQEKSLSCLNADEASPAHRAAAGVMAMMLTTFTWHDDIPNIYKNLEPLLNHPTVSNSTKFLGQMVYHTVAGDLGTAQTAAVHLINEELRNKDIGGLLRAYGNATVTYRIAGEFEEAKRCIREALNIAETQGLFTAKIRLLPLLGNLALEIGDLSLARYAEQKLSNLEIDSSNKFSRLELHSLRTRLALAEGRLREARVHLPSSLEAALADSISHRRTYAIALQVAVLLAERETISDLILDEFSRAFQQSKRGVHQAFAACTLMGAYQAKGRARKARLAMKDYERVRREPWPVPQHMKDWFLRITSTS
jgi:tetratricopeptide (TPR) repeat protein